MFDRLAQMASRYQELERLLGQPGLASDPGRLRETGQALAALRPAMEAYGRWKQGQEALQEDEELLADGDPAIRELARAEVAARKAKLAEIESELKRLLAPVEPDDDRNVVLEIRAGTGGEEAALFAGDLFRMYTRYAERNRWRVETLSLSSSGAGGVREVIATISGKSVYRSLKHERGVHRVQRVPATESAGRIHTSTVTVAVLPEAEELDLRIEAKDLRFDVYRSSGPGGQSVNTTDSAVRVTHLPSGLVVTCQDEKSQHKNKARALKILRSRLYDLEQQRVREERARERRVQIGTGERSERIRTYNFPQNRVTDHRVNLTLHKLDRILEGELDELIERAALDLQLEGWG